MADHATRVGMWGVDVFFALSGYLITRILMNSSETSGPKAYFVNFMARRFLRIAPLYFVYVAFLFLILPTMTGSTADSTFSAPPRPWSICLWFSDLIPGLGTDRILTSHLWSLAIEEQFYLLWPAVVLLVPSSRLGPLTLAIAGVSAVARMVAWRLGVWEEALHRCTPFALDGIALGSWLAWLERYRPDRFARLAPLAWRSVLLGLAAITALAFSSIDMAGLIALGRLPAALVGLGLVALASNGRADRLLIHSILLHAGSRCYGLYLLHPIPLVAIRLLLDHMARSGISTSKWGIVAITLGPLTLAFLAAEISWILIERPALGLKRFVSYRRVSARREILVNEASAG